MDDKPDGNVAGSLGNMLPSGAMPRYEQEKNRMSRETAMQFALAFIGHKVASDRTCDCLLADAEKILAFLAPDK